VFFSTLVSYTLQRLFRLKSIAQYNNKAWVVENKKTAIFLTIIGIIGTLFTLPQFLSFSVLIWLIPSGIVSLLYSLKRLRDIPYLKIFLISISWGVICGVIPFIIEKNYDIELILFNFTIITCYITAITIPFDIRDLGLDEDTKRTIPQVMGIPRAKTSALIILGISIVLFLFIFNPLQSIIYGISSLFSGYLIYKSSSLKPDIYFTLYIDGHIIFQFLLIFLLC
jgi:hypothetical protein